MNGKEIRTHLCRKGMKQWELAKELNISESTLIRWLRSDLPKDKEQRIMKAISDYKKEGEAR